MAQEFRSPADGSHAVTPGPELRLELSRPQKLAKELFALGGIAVQRIVWVLMDAFNGTSLSLGLAQEILLVLVVWAVVQPLLLGGWFLFVEPYVVCSDTHLVLGRGQVDPTRVDLAAIRSVQVERAKGGRRIVIEHGYGQIPVRRALGAPWCWGWPASSVARFEREASLLLGRMGRVEGEPQLGSRF